MVTSKHDIAIIGAGAAGLHLAMSLIRSKMTNLKIVILEPTKKEMNDKTYCFWEEGSGYWDSILGKSWKTCSFQYADLPILKTTHPYIYKMIESSQFYEHCKSSIQKSSNIHWVQDYIEKIDDKGNITGKASSYHAEWIFDSRPPDISTLLDNPNNHTLLQHFLGWRIKTNLTCFREDQFTMMDFRVAENRNTSFMYVLPFSDKEALIEYTFFDQHILNQEDYELKLSTYIKNEFRTGGYEILSKEQGVIPMSDYPFHHQRSKKVIKIGAAGGWIKPSSGYSFKNCEKFADRIIKNLQNKKHPSEGLISSRHRFYDRVLLKILSERNNMGPKLFDSLYQKNTLGMIFKFLDEESHFLEDLNIMASFDSRPFLKAIAQLMLKGDLLSSPVKMENS
jgi:lycopene beta-cyclase